MTTPLRILHLEDNATDRERVRAALTDKQIACEFVHAASKTEFAIALAREKFDLILSNFSLPGLEDGAALAFARGRSFRTRLSSLSPAASAKTARLRA